MVRVNFAVFQMFCVDCPVLNVIFADGLVLQMVALDLLFPDMPG